MTIMFIVPSRRREIIKTEVNVNTNKENGASAKEILEKPEFLIANIMPGKLNALVKNIMQQVGGNDPEEAVRLINSGEYLISQPQRNWQQKNNIIYPSVTSDGLAMSGWPARLEGKGIFINLQTREILTEAKPVSTKGITTKLAIIKGRDFVAEKRTTENIRRKGKSLNFTAPSLEMAFLIRDSFSSLEVKAMGFKRLVIMHEPISYRGCHDFLLYVLDNNNGSEPSLQAVVDAQDFPLRANDGFVFVAPAQVIDPDSCWKEHNGIYYVKVRTDKTSGQDLLKRLSDKNIFVSRLAENVFLNPSFGASDKFIPEGYNSYEYVIGIIPASLKNKFDDDYFEEKLVSKILNRAEASGFERPSPRIASALREVISNKDMQDMDLEQIIIFHRPAPGYRDITYCLSITQDIGRTCLRTYAKNAKGADDGQVGFAFIASRELIK